MKMFNLIYKNRWKSRPYWDIWSCTGKCMGMDETQIFICKVLI